MTNEIRRGWYDDGEGRLYIYGLSPIDGEIMAQCAEGGTVFAHTGKGLQYLGETLPSEPDHLAADRCRKAHILPPETIDVSEWWHAAWELQRGGWQDYGWFPTREQAMGCAKEMMGLVGIGNKYGVMRVGSTEIEVGGIKA